MTTTYNNCLHRATTLHDVSRIEQYQGTHASVEYLFDCAAYYHTADVVENHPQPSAKVLEALYFPVNEDEPVPADVVIEYGHPFISTWIITRDFVYEHATHGMVASPYFYTIFAVPQQRCTQQSNKCVDSATAHMEVFPVWKGDILVLKTDAATGQFLNTEYDDVYECKEHVLEAIANGVIGT